MSGRLSHWRVLRHLLSHAATTLRAQRLVIAGAFCALLLETLFRLAEPWPLQYLVDHLILPLSGAPAASVSWSLAALCCGLLVCIVAGRALAAYAWTVGFAIAGNRVLLNIRARVFAHLQTLSTHFHGKSRAGDLLTRLIDDVGMVRDVVVTATLPMAGSLVLMLVMLGVMLWLNWRLALIVVAGYPLLWLIARRKKQRIHSAATAQRRQVSKVAATVAETLASIRVVQTLGMSADINSTFDVANNADLQSGVKVKRLSAGMERTVDVVIGLVTAATLLAGVHEVAVARISLGELLVFMAYVRSTAKPVRNWAKFSARIAKSTAGAERILEILETEPGVQEPDRPTTLEYVRGQITFNNVSFAHGSDQPVLQHANLRIDAGETVAIIGESGIGKSTVLNLMMRLYDPQAGEILLDNIPLTNLGLQHLRQQFAVALQDPLLFYGSIYDNIAHSRADSQPEQIQQAADLALVTRFTKGLPQGLHTPLGEGAANLSNGQRQRIALARALLKEAPVFVVDEPLTALDPETAVAVGHALSQYASHRTTVIVTHDWSQALLADRIITITDQQFVEVPRSQLIDARVTTDRVPHEA